MVSNKRKAWDEAQERGLIEEYVEYDDLTEKEIVAIIETADEEEAVRCTECGEIGLDRGDGVILCDECYDDITSVTERFYEDEEEDESEDDNIPEPEDEPDEEPVVENEPVVEEPVVEDEPEPVVKTPVVAPKPKPVPKKYIKITRNVAVERIPVGTLVTFKCKAGSNIRTYAGDMSVGLVLKKRSDVKTYSGKLTRKLKKDIKLKKIILLR